MLKPFSRDTSTEGRQLQLAATHETREEEVPDEIAKKRHQHVGDCIRKQREKNCFLSVEEWQVFGIEPASGALFIR